MSTTAMLPDSVMAWLEKLCFRMHLWAYTGIRWSIKQRMRNLGYDSNKLAKNWDPLSLLEYYNEDRMNDCKDHLKVTHHLIKEKQLGKFPQKQPSVMHECLASDRTELHNMAERAVRMARDAKDREQQTLWLLEQLKEIIASMKSLNRDSHKKKPPVLATPRASQ